MQVRTKFYIFSWGSFPLCFQDGLHSYEVQGLWMLLMQGGVEHAGGTQPAQEGSSLQCRGLLGWGVIERISLGRNIIRSASLQGSCLIKVSWKIDHRKEGQCVRHQLSDILRAWNPLGEVFLSSSHSDLPHYQRRPRYWTVLTKLPTFQAYDKVPYTNKFQYGQTILKRPLSLKYHVPLPNSSPPWHPGILSSNKAFSGTLYPVVDQEKQTCRYSPAKEARAACHIGQVSWPLNRFPLVAHNPLRLQKDWEMGSRAWKGCGRKDR